MGITPKDLFNALAHDTRLRCLMLLQRHGELLKGALGRIEPGATEIELDDYETGEKVTIALDPKATPKENLDATFKRYQKLLRRLTKAGGQVDEARPHAEPGDEVGGRSGTSRVEHGDERAIRAGARRRDAPPRQAPC